jgi:hypothetical protein
LPYIPPFIKWVFSNKTKYFTPLDIIFTAESAEYAEKDKCKTSAIFASSAVKNLMGEPEKILNVSILMEILFDLQRPESSQSFFN